jgi:Fe-S oxidoreductase/FAD/FMN-containing dehydrogenase
MRVYELTDSLKSELKQMFGDWVNLDLEERKYYDHDIGNIPKLIRPFIGNTVPAAVVKAMNEDDVVKLLTWAARNQVPVVPRAAASSGYGGVIPVQGGIVLDATSLNQIYNIDRENMVVEVGAGIVWEDLEIKLSAQGLAPRQLPSSAPASTVGGWFAQGGTGYGGYAYGWFNESVMRIRLATPSGELKDIEGDELQTVYGSMGTLGVITRVWLRVRNSERIVPFAVSFESARALSDAVKEIYLNNLELYTLNFINPEGAHLKNRTPVKTHHGHPEEKGPELPEEFILLIGSFESRIEELDRVRKIVEPLGGKVLSSEIAEHEWEERYKPMKIKRLGPSLIPAEVVVPLNSLYSVLSEIEHEIKLPVLIEGIGVKGKEIVLLCLIPHDERRFSFNFAFGLSLSILKIAMKYGGRPYAAGLYFGGYAERVFGEKGLQDKLKLKKNLDASGVMNPDKLTGKGVLKNLIAVASVFEPIVRLTGNMARIDLKERPFKAKEIPPQIAWYAYSCAQCGYCVKECDQYYGRGWESQSPRGKFYWLKRYIEGKEELTQEQVDKFMVCTTCEMCSFRCQLDMPIEESWEELRGVFIKDKGFLTIPPFEIMKASLEKEKNIWANYSQNRDAWVPEEIKPKIKDKAEIAYFAGCTASYVENEIAQATATLLDKAGIEFTYLGKDEACCGIPMLVAGKWETFEEIMKHNVSKMKERGVKTVVTSCPACYLVWGHYYKEWAKEKGIDYPFEAKHYSEVLADKLDKLPFVKEINEKVTFHDSCHMGRALGVYEEPRDLIKAVPGVEYKEMEHNRERAHCCGSVLSLIGEPPVAYEIGAIRLNEAKKAGADTILAVCPCCQFQLRVSNDKKQVGVKVRDLASFVAEALGYNFKDATDDAIAMWVTFEAMIKLLEPQNMADMMEELFPQMFEAMPGYMVSMMKVAKRVPGMLGLMEKMIPSMMPMLMPMIMPKVLPDMLAAVERRVPMPEFMKQQMPDLLPKAMESLLPKMLPKIAPLVAPKMVKYVKENL